MMHLLLGRLLALPASAATVSRSAPLGQQFMGCGSHLQQPATCYTYCKFSVSITAAGGQGHLLLSPHINQMSRFNPPRTLEETLDVVRIPPTGRNVGPRVEHIEITADGQLSEVIATALQLPTWFAIELLRFGAVHHSPIMPNCAAAARRYMPPEHVKRVEKLVAEGRAKLGRNPKLQHPKRVLEDVPVGAGGYVRVHVHPKRFPAAHSVDWKQQILADMPEYVVVNKPAGVQVPPTVDNILESVVCCTAQALGLPQPHSALLNAHRLDAGTSGAVVLAKNPSFAHWFSSLLKHKPDNIIKVYKGLSREPPPLGRMVHYAVVRNRAPGEPAHTHMRRPTAEASAALGQEAGIDQSSQEVSSSNEGSVDGAADEQGAYCELIVLQVQEVELTGSAASEWGSTAYESTIQLVTGRTHQIRAQMAAEGCPLLGDHLYQALAVMWQQEQHRQQCNGRAVAQQRRNHQQQQQGEQCRDSPDRCKSDSPEQEPQQQSSAFAGAEWSRVYQEDPLKPIGLQAHVLRIRDVDGRMTGDARASQQQQQQQRPGQAEDQLPVPLSQQSTRDSLGFSASTQALTSTVSTLLSSGGTPGSRGDESWVDFCAGVPWWRGQ